MKIVGIKIIKKKIIKNTKGDIRKFINKKSEAYKKFGEIYFSFIKKNKIKGWNYHKKNTCLISLVAGKVSFNFVDDRKYSKSYKSKNKITLNINKNNIILIPPKIWFCFKAINEDSILVNFLNNIHSKNETKKQKIENIKEIF